MTHMRRNFLVIETTRALVHQLGVLPLIKYYKLAILHVTIIIIIIRV